jgi:hypothetical protein
MRATGPGKVRVAVVGSSVVDLGVDPARLGVPAYNVALRGASADIIATWTRRVVVPRLRPMTVVIGLTSRELSPNDAEQIGATRDFNGAPAVRSLLGTERWTDKADRSAGRVSEIFRYRTVLRRPLSWFGGRDGLDSGVRLTSLGWDRSKADGQYDASEGVRDFFRSAPLHDFTIGDHEVRVLTELATALRRGGTDVVVVNMPVTADYLTLHPHGESDYRAATEAMQRVAERSGSRFIDVGIWPNQLFGDPIHLNGAGVRRLAGELAPELAKP